MILAKITVLRSKLEVNSLARILKINQKAENRDLVNKAHEK